MTTYTNKEKFYRCCGYFCSLMACIGVYFYIVMLVFQYMGNPFVMTMLEGLQQPSSDDKNFKIAFFSAVIVSEIPNKVAQLALHGWLLLMRPLPD